MTALMIAWLAATAGLLVWLALVGAVWRTGVATEGSTHPALPRAAMHVVFVTAVESGVVVDGLLDIGRSSIGVPTTWLFRTPHDAVRRDELLAILARWALQGDAVTVVLDDLHRPRPTVVLSGDDATVRVSVGGVLSRFGDDLAGRA